MNWIVWSLLAAVFAAATALLAKAGVEGVNPLVANAVRTTVVFGLAWLVVLGGGAMSSAQGLSSRTWWLLGGSGLATGLSWLCYMRALQMGPVSRVAPIDKLSVVLVAVLGVWLLGEQLSLRGWIGVALMGIGAALVAWP